MTLLLAYLLVLAVFAALAPWRRLPLWAVVALAVALLAVAGAAVGAVMGGM